MVEFLIVKAQRGAKAGFSSDFDHAFVDGSARSASAFIVHRGGGGFLAGFLVLFEHDDLGILSTEFDHAEYIRVLLFHGERDSVHLLDELGTERFTGRAGAGTGSEDTKAFGWAIGKGGFDLGQQLQ